MNRMNAETARILGAAGMLFARAAGLILELPPAIGQVDKLEPIEGIGNHRCEQSHVRGTMAIVTGASVSTRRCECWLRKDKQSGTYAPLFVALQMDNGQLEYFRCIGKSPGSATFEKTDFWEVKIQTSLAMLPR